MRLSNNLAENSMRPVALGRKNWIHIGSPQAGPKVAAILSIVESCRRLKIPVRAYLAAVLPGFGERQHVPKSHVALKGTQKALQASCPVDSCPAFPDPFTHAAPGANDRRQMPRCCLEQADGLNQIGLAGRVGTDQHVQALKVKGHVLEGENVLESD